MRSSSPRAGDETRIPTIARTRDSLPLPVVSAILEGGQAKEAVRMAE